MSQNKAYPSGLPWVALVAPALVVGLVALAGIAVVAKAGSAADVAAPASLEVGRGSLTRVDLDGLDCIARKTMEGVGVDCDFEGHTKRFDDGALPSVDRGGVTVAAARSGEDLCVVADSAQGTAVTCSFGYFTRR